ncbi:hypothetical protein ACS0TY_003711 [Phlomoides rotata]
MKTINYVVNMEIKSLICLLVLWFFSLELLLVRLRQILQINFPPNQPSKHVLVLLHASSSELTTAVTHEE